jgi:DUF917 family protein
MFFCTWGRGNAMIKLSIEDLEDVLEGAALLGSGGGGSKAIGEEMIAALKKLDKKFVLFETAPFSNLADDDIVVIVADIGGNEAPMPNQDDIAWNAFQTLEQHVKAQLNKPIKYVVPIELGAENSLAPAYVAGRAGIPLLDADGCGRAVPTLPLSTFAVADLCPSPAAIAGTRGDTAVLQTSNAASLEMLARNITLADQFANSASMAFSPMSGEEFKKAAVPGGISRAREIGKRLREFRQSKSKYQTPIEAISEINGLTFKVLLEGKLGKQQDNVIGGFDMVRVVVSGKTTSVVLLAKNEILIAWDPTCTSPMATGPDSITLLTKNGQTMSLAESDDYAGQDVYLLAIQAQTRIDNHTFRQLFCEQFEELGYIGPTHSPFISGN